jgi:replicative DNA helicase
VLLRTIEDLRELAEQHPDSDLLSVGAILEAQGPPESMLERLTTLEGVKLGFDNIDANTHGLQPETLNIVAARPSMGKTAWMCKAARHSAVIEERVTAVFTLEQKKETMIRRMLSIESRVAYDDILTGSLTPHHGRMMLEQREMLLRAPLYLDDQPGLTVSRIKSKCMRLQRTKGLDIVFVDQLSKVSNADVYQKGMPKSEWVGKQSAAFKLMAQELKVPVVVFNQLKRPEGKGVVMPSLSDLKESGSLEEDADVVIFLHRPEYYDKGDENLRDKGQMILAKNREGKTDTFDCTFKGSIMRWEDGGVQSAQASLIEEYVLPHWER